MQALNSRNIIAIRKRVIYTLKLGLIVGFINLVIGFLINWLIGAAVPTISTQYQNTEVFRPWSDPLMLIYFAYPFILGIVSYYLWRLLKPQLKGEGVNKALQFAWIYFVISTIPGMFITYTSMQISLAMVLLWSATGFLEAFVAGIIFSRIGKSS